MKRIILKKLRIENFKGYKEAEFDFYGTTRVTGHNGVGKSSIAAAYMWLFLNINYDLVNNPDIRRKIEGKPVNDVLVSVEATLEIDGVIVTAKKVQKRSFKKDGSYSDDNSYFINDVPKTLRDFNAYFDFDMKLFKLCTNINAFLDQEPGEMREFLFGLVPNVANLDVARQFDELAELVPMLEKYTAEEVGAMNKASIRNIKKELDPIPSMISENRRYLVDDVDAAELELQKNALQEKIAGIQAQLDDSEAARAEWQKKADNIMELQFRKSDLERAAVDRLREERAEIQRLVDAAEKGFNDAVRMHGDAEQEISILESRLATNDKQRNSFLEQWRAAVAETFPRETEEFVELTDADLLCPTCGQPLPEGLRMERIARADADREEFYRKKETDRESFKKTRTEKITQINASGMKLKEQIDADTAKIKEMQVLIEQAKADKIKFNADKSSAMERLGALPTEPDLSGNQEYEALCAEIQKKEEAMKAENSGADYRAALRGQMQQVQTELGGVKAKLLAVAKNVDYEERIADLEERRMTLEQKKADAEKIAYLLEQLEEKKNTLLRDKINEHFRFVKWDLFARGKNGQYLKNYCKPVIEYRDYGSDTNTGREIEAKIDIAMAVQRATGIFCPIFLDGAESIDPWRIPKCESQLIVLCRTDDDELKIEEVA